VKPRYACGWKRCCSYDGSTPTYVLNIELFFVMKYLNVVPFSTELLFWKVLRVSRFLRQKKRRAEWKQVVSSTESPGGVLPVHHPVDEQTDESAGLRARLRKCIREKDWPGAASAWNEFIEEDPEGTLPEKVQLELANRLFSADQRREAATAYEQFLSNYPTSSEVQEVELMLGMLYARDLQRPDDAEPLLEKAMNQLLDERQRTLARTLLDEIRGPEAEPTP